MNAELKAKWTAALRSGEYKQARGALEKDGGFCCLGVLCKVAGLHTKREESFEGYNEIYALVGGRDVSDELSMRNDGLQSSISPSVKFREHSFDEIADYIESNVPSDDRTHDGDAAAQREPT